MKRKTTGITLFLLLTTLMLVLAACGGAKPEPTKAPTAAPAKAAAPTQAPEPTKAPDPTKATEPTKASVPTKAPEPTKATEPTKAAEPTKAPAPTKAPDPTKATEPTKAPEAQAPTGKAGYDLLIQAARAQLAQKAFRATITSEDGGRTSKTVLEFVAPDRFHVIPSAGQEMIILKDATYMKQDDKWIKSPINMGAMISGLFNQQNIEEMLKEMDVADLKFVGADTVNGKPMWVYQHASSMKVGEQAIKSQGKSWLGITDKLVYKIESEADSLVNKGGKTKTTVLYDYDPNIKIEAPVP